MLVSVHPSGEPRESMLASTRVSFAASEHSVALGGRPSLARGPRGAAASHFDTRSKGSPSIPDLTPVSPAGASEWGSMADAGGAPQTTQRRSKIRTGIKLAGLTAFHKFRELHRRQKKKRTLFRVRGELTIKQADSYLDFESLLLLRKMLQRFHRVETGGGANTNTNTGTSAANLGGPHPAFQRAGTSTRKFLLQSAAQSYHPLPDRHSRHNASIASQATSPAAPPTPAASRKTQLVPLDLELFLQLPQIAATLRSKATEQSATVTTKIPEVPATATAVPGARDGPRRKSLTHAADFAGLLSMRGAAKAPLSMDGGDERLLPSSLGRSSPRAVDLLRFPRMAFCIVHKPAGMELSEKKAKDGDKGAMVTAGDQQKKIRQRPSLFLYISVPAVELKLSAAWVRFFILVSTKLGRPDSRAAAAANAKNSSSNTPLLSQRTPLDRQRGDSKRDSGFLSQKSGVSSQGLVPAEGGASGGELLEVTVVGTCSSIKFHFAIATGGSRNGAFDLDMEKPLRLSFTSGKHISSSESISMATGGNDMPESGPTRAVRALQGSFFLCLRGIRAAIHYGDSLLFRASLGRESRKDGGEREETIVWEDEKGKDSKGVSGLRFFCGSALGISPDDPLAKHLTVLLQMSEFTIDQLSARKLGDLLLCLVALEDIGQQVGGAGGGSSQPASAQKQPDAQAKQQPGAGLAVTSLTQTPLPLAQSDVHLLNESVWQGAPTPPQHAAAHDSNWSILGGENVATALQRRQKPVVFLYAEARRLAVRLVLDAASALYPHDLVFKVRKVEFDVYDPGRSPVGTRQDRLEVYSRILDCALEAPGRLGAGRDQTPSCDLSAVIQLDSLCGACTVQPDCDWKITMERNLRQSKAFRQLTTRRRPSSSDSDRGSLDNEGEDAGGGQQEDPETDDEVDSLADSDSTGIDTSEAEAETPRSAGDHSPATSFESAQGTLMPSQRTPKSGRKRRSWTSQNSRTLTRRASEMNMKIAKAMLPAMRWETKLNGLRVWAFHREDGEHKPLMDFGLKAVVLDCWEMPFLPVLLRKTGGESESGSDYSSYSGTHSSITDKSYSSGRSSRESGSGSSASVLSASSALEDSLSQEDRGAGPKRSESGTSKSGLQSARGRGGSETSNSSSASASGTEGEDLGWQTGPQRGFSNTSGLEPLNALGEGEEGENATVAVPTDGEGPNGDGEDGSRGDEGRLTTLQGSRALSRSSGGRGSANPTVSAAPSGSESPKPSSGGDGSSQTGANSTDKEGGDGAASSGTPSEGDGGKDSGESAGSSSSSSSSSRDSWLFHQSGRVGGFGHEGPSFPGGRRLGDQKDGLSVVNGLCPLHTPSQTHGSLRIDSPHLWLKPQALYYGVMSFTQTAQFITALEETAFVDAVQNSKEQKEREAKEGESGSREVEGINWDGDTSDENSSDSEGDQMSDDDAGQGEGPSAGEETQGGNGDKLLPSQKRHIGQGLTDYNENGGRGSLEHGGPGQGLVPWQACSLSSRRVKGQILLQIFDLSVFVHSSTEAKTDPRFVHSAFSLGEAELVLKTDPQRDPAWEERAFRARLIEEAPWWTLGLTENQNSRRADKEGSQQQQHPSPAAAVQFGRRKSIWFSTLGAADRSFSEIIQKSDRPTEDDFSPVSVDIFPLTLRQGRHSVSAVLKKSQNLIMSTDSEGGDANEELRLQIPPRLPHQMRHIEFVVRGCQLSKLPVPLSSIGSLHNARSLTKKTSHIELADILAEIQRHQRGQVTVPVPVKTAADSSVGAAVVEPGGEEAPAPTSAFSVPEDPFSAAASAAAAVCKSHNVLLIPVVSVELRAKETFRVKPKTVDKDSMGNRPNDRRASVSTALGTTTLTATDPGSASIGTSPHFPADSSGSRGASTQLLSLPEQAAVGGGGASLTPASLSTGISAGSPMHPSPSMLPSPGMKGHGGESNGMELSAAKGRDHDSSPGIQIGSSSLSSGLCLWSIIESGVEARLAEWNAKRTKTEREKERGVNSLSSERGGDRGRGAGRSKQGSSGRSQGKEVSEGGGRDKKGGQGGSLVHTQSGGGPSGSSSASSGLLGLSDLESTKVGSHSHLLASTPVDFLPFVPLEVHSKTVYKFISDFEKQHIAVSADIQMYTDLKALVDNLSQSITDAFARTAPQPPQSDKRTASVASPGAIPAMGHIGSPGAASWELTPNLTLNHLPIATLGPGSIDVSGHSNIPETLALSPAASSTLSPLATLKQKMETLSPADRRRFRERLLHVVSDRDHLWRLSAQLARPLDARIPLSLLFPPLYAPVQPSRALPLPRRPILDQFHHILMIEFERVSAISPAAGGQDMGDLTYERILCQALNAIGETLGVGRPRAQRAASLKRKAKTIQLAPTLARLETWTPSLQKVLSWLGIQERAVPESILDAVGGPLEDLKGGGFGLKENSVEQLGGKEEGWMGEMTGKGNEDRLKWAERR
uniref:Uncharacterized protein n=1 Tax=Chromera velia CCMP2878 TaxID=1169474 RepID=A0A0K6SBH6_9ALVE|eukprot:Cvel_13435.t2-p1 / transcript=Cvel_13435.t2 / gene=Cvel_13435 / organism=Chromera_velia_CCMP2878 / gene_product=hypothetical protein / transcript_product=hypothetical protein / location=Cvel_scaffold917:19782-28150(+) / protein_length=2436 / sequence_SO=supercontig / SO=protein_coding / is_pseudo=false